MPKHAMRMIMGCDDGEKIRKSENQRPSAKGVGAYTIANNSCDLSCKWQKIE